jgi:hypothetical protein
LERIAFRRDAACAERLRRSNKKVTKTPAENWVEVAKTLWKTLPKVMGVERFRDPDARISGKNG